MSEKLWRPVQDGFKWRGPNKELIDYWRAHLIVGFVPNGTAIELPDHLRLFEAIDVDRPTIVCLCGSTRFWREFQRASLSETLASKIVLSIGAASGTDDEHFGNLPREEYDRVKAMLDELHLRKIDLADEVLILNVGGYIGESTSRELAYARKLGKRIRFFEEPTP